MIIMNRRLSIRAIIYIVHLNERGSDVTEKFEPPSITYRKAAHWLTELTEIKFSFYEIMAPYRKRKREANDYWMFNHKRFRYHGNYCGPGWSGGKYQNSIKGKKGSAVDEFDETCRKHDAYYADSENPERLTKADFKFFRQNYGKSLKRSAAAIAVGTQGLIRKFTSFSQKNSQTGDQSMARSRSPSRSRSVGRRSRSPRRNRPVPPTPSRTPARTSDVLMRSRSRSRSRSAAPSGSRRAGTVSGLGHSGKIGSKNRRLKPMSSMLKRGVQVCTEQANVLSTTDCQYIGHATCPNSQMKKAFWRAMLKTLLIRAGKLNPNWNGIPSDVNVGDSFIVEYRLNMDPATGFSQAKHVYVNGDTQEIIAMAWDATMDGRSTQFTINRMLYRPNDGPVGSVTIYLNNAEVDVDCFSQLKIQNQSVTVATDDTSEDVTNVPLSGKCYQGRGTGTKYIVEDTAGVPFLCDPEYGVIAKAAVVNDLAEPPHGRLFEQVTSTGKCSIGPGEVQTSTLRYRKTIKLQMFITLIFDFATELSPHKYKMKYLGEFKMYGLEKMIDSVANLAENNIKVAYEHDLKIAIAIQPRTRHVTTTLYLQNIGAP